MCLCLAVGDKMAICQSSPRDNFRGKAVSGVHFGPVRRPRSGLRLCLHHLLLLVDDCAPCRSELSADWLMFFTSEVYMNQPGGGGVQVRLLSPALIFVIESDSTFLLGWAPNEASPLFTSHHALLV